MRIAIASTGRWLDSRVDYHTGRAPSVIVYDTFQEGFDVLDNWLSIDRKHWAGSNVADQIIRHGALSAAIGRQASLR